jgi:hypothetical protein
MKFPPVTEGLGTGSPAVREVHDAHQAAVGQALAYLESVAGHGLRGHQGDGRRADRITTDGWIVAAFEHHTSRAEDPQLHTHLVVPNLPGGVVGPGPPGRDGCARRYAPPCDRESDSPSPSTSAATWWRQRSRSGVRRRAGLTGAQ